MGRRAMGRTEGGGEGGGGREVEGVHAGEVPGPEQGPAGDDLTDPKLGLPPGTGDEREDGLKAMPWSRVPPGMAPTLE